MTSRFLLLAVVAASTDARAQSASADAQSLFDQARVLMSEQRYPEACAAFASSQRLAPSPATLYAVAVCREAEGKLATAWGTFVEVDHVYRSSPDPIASALVTKARERAAALKPRLSSLTVSVPAASAAADLAIERDGTAVDRGTFDRPLPVDGGEHTISVRRPGFQAWTTTITVQREGEAQTVTIPVLEPVPVAPAQPLTAPAAPAPTPSPPSRVPAYALGGVAILLGGSALALDLVARNQYADASADFAVADAQPKSAETDAALADARSRADAANLKRYLAQGLGAAAVVSAGVAIYFFVRRGDEPAPSTTALRIVPALSPETAGLTLTGGW